MTRVINLWSSYRSNFPIASFSFTFILMVVLTTLIRSGFGLPVDIRVELAYALVMVSAVLALNSFFMLMYRYTRHRTIYLSTGGTVLALLISVPFTYGLFAMLPTPELSPKFLELMTMAAVFGMLSCRYGVTHLKSAGIASERILIYGIGTKATAVKQALNKANSVIDIVGFYPSKVNETQDVPDGYVMSRDQSLTDIVRAKKVDEIVVALTEQRGGALPLQELLECKLQGVRIFDLEAYFEKMLGQLRLDSLRAGWLIFSDGFYQTIGRSIIKSTSKISLMHCPICQ